MADIYPNQDYDILYRPSFNTASGDCQIASAFGIAVFKYDSSNYGLGTNRRFRIVATYPI